MDIQSVVLDADGVLIPPWGFARYLQREHPQIAAQTGEFFQGVFEDCLVGKANLKEVLPPYLEKWGWPGSLDNFMQRWFEEEDKTDTSLVTIVRMLRRQAVRCYLATNQERYRLAYMRERMGLAGLFDEIFCSVELGAKKPDRGFFEAVTEGIGVRPAQIAFWDDGQANVDAARTFGWRAEHYTGHDAFLRQLKQMVPVDLPAT